MVEVSKRTIRVREYERRVPVHASNRCYVIHVRHLGWVTSLSSEDCVTMGPFSYALRLRKRDVPLVLFTLSVHYPNARITVWKEAFLPCPS